MRKVRNLVKFTKICEKCGKYENSQHSINIPLDFIRYFAHWRFDIKLKIMMLPEFANKYNSHKKYMKFQGFRKILQASHNCRKIHKTPPNAKYLIKFCWVISGFEGMQGRGGGACVGMNQPGNSRYVPGTMCQDEEIPLIPNPRERFCSPRLGSIVQFVKRIERFCLTNWSFV